MPGKLIIISAPSGAGKTTIVRHLLHQDLNLEFSISACNRQKRENEIDDKDYYFLSTEEFIKKIENEEFIEWEEVYENQFYGTLKNELNRIWSKGSDVIFDIDVKGGINIKNQFKSQALSIFIMPLSIEILIKRLKKRFTETETAIKKRIQKAEFEISFSNRFDKIIRNDNLNDTFEETHTIVKNFLSEN